MHILLALFIVLASATGLGAIQPDDGIFLLTQGGPATQIMTQDGRNVSLGVQQELIIHKSEITSQNNANDRFYVQLTVPYDENLDASSYIMVVSGTAYRQSGSGSMQKETSLLSFDISGYENARQVGSFLKATVAYRRHPQHNLRVSFIPARQEFSAGEQVNVIFQITNVGTNRISFMKGGCNRAARDNQYFFSARHEGQKVDDIGTSYHFGGIAMRCVLNPGDVFEDAISLSKWFAFDKAGIYEVHGSYYLDFKDADSDSLRTIWEDRVAADFSVNIRSDKDLEQSGPAYPPQGVGSADP